MCPLPAFMLARRSVNRFAGFDADATAYLQAVEAADGQPLEAQVLSAINAFVVGLKTDGIWGAIGAMCVLAGARTLAGALVPLSGPAPSNNAFLGADYNRKTGLIGNGSTKFLNSNYSHTAEPQNDRHLSVWVSARVTASNSEFFIGNGAGNFTSGTSVLGCRNGSDDTRFNSVSSSIETPAGRFTGFHGITRSSSSSYTRRVSGANTSVSRTSQAPRSGTVFVFASNLSGAAEDPTTVRLYHYSIGSSLDLALLDSRIGALKSALDAFLP